MRISPMIRVKTLRPVTPSLCPRILEYRSTTLMTAHIVVVPFIIKVMVIQIETMIMLIDKGVCNIDNRLGRQRQ